MHLDDYLQAEGISQGDFGKKLIPPASQGLVSQWIRGITRITLDYALQIQGATDNKVAPQDCADMYSNPAKRVSVSTSSEKPKHPNRRHDDPKVAA
ncbi:hypothetical protein [Noviherbaspirillum malthae]|uniref:hypothetical protein n=1 Tax=Noviherbaspirillum malthae TaxID=1260987 RepID=UPI00188E35E4|nr:hypothetical protein [Noviherbaspirillum malthae]